MSSVPPPPFDGRSGDCEQGGPSIDAAREKDDVEAKFSEALEMAPLARARFVEEACRIDAALGERLRRLLAAHEKAEDQFEEVISPDLQCEFLRLKPEEAGDRIGNYRLLEQIGEGGFGVVWLAEQEKPVRRRVALKIIKIGMDTKEVIARFEQERQALAMMDHPNIAKVFDAGMTPHGRPFFGMELVRGIKITNYCDQAKLTTRDRLELFIAVCQAVQHAHQKGIIHRDLKPSNILVTTQDGVPVPKVIDFGVAKATQRQRLTDLTIYTEFEQMIGTPLYMSPEQAEMSGLDIDTRSDIYSLGVLLYELLTGGTPFDPEEMMRQRLDQIRRTIREQEPKTPSTFLRTMAADRRYTIAEHRRSDPARLTRLLCGDLDWIVMKALEKDRSRRYETANELGMDIRCFLQDEPVSAGPPTARYRFHKFVRRHKAILRTAALGITILLAGMIVSTWQAVRASRAEQIAIRKAHDESMARAEAEAARVEAEAMTKFLMGVFASPEPARKGPDITVAESLTGALRQMNTQLATYPDQRHKLQRAIAWVLHSLGYTNLIIPYAEESRNYFAKARPPEHLDSLKAKHELAIYYMTVGRTKEAADIFEEVYRIEQRILPPGHSEYWEVLQTMANLATCYHSLGRKDEAFTIRNEALNICRARYKDDHAFTIRAKEDIARSYQDAGEWSKALAFREEVLAYRRKTFKEGDPWAMVAAIERLAQSHDSAGNNEAAATLRTEAERVRQAAAQRPLPTVLALDPKMAKQRISALLAARRFDQAIKDSRELVKVQLEHPAPPGDEAEAEAWLASALLLQAGTTSESERDSESTRFRKEAEELIKDLLARRGSLATCAARTDLFCRYGLWKEAARFGRALYEQHPENPWSVYRFAPLLIQTQEASAFDALREEILHPISSTAPEAREAFLTSFVARFKGQGPNVFARIVCLQPVNDASLRWATLLSDRALSLEKDKNWHSYVLTRSLTACRAGEFSDAVAMLKPVLSHLTPAAEVVGGAVLAMAECGLNHPDDARTALQDGTKLLEANWFSSTRVALGGNPHDWLIAHILLSEAKTVLEAQGIR